MGNDSYYETLANKMSKITGVQFDDKNKSMVKSRIDKRIRELKLSGIEEYVKFVNKSGSTEVDELISLMTTHHTYFMREKNQFDYLIKQLPALVQKLKGQGRNTIKIWSAACSYGEEVYTLSMILRYHLDKIDPTMKVELTGSDICQKAVKHAERGVYLWNALKRVPAMYLSKCWLRGDGKIQHYVKATKKIKDCTNFKVVNLIENKDNIFNQKFDMIFCRNVFIYFSPLQIKKIVDRFSNCLEDDGVLFVGISETLTDYDKQYRHAGQSIYLKGAESTEKPVETVAQVLAPVAKKIKRVLCVDDSPTVQKILKKILVKETGYEVVHCAGHGGEAEEWLKTNSCDVMILDLHMPVMDGVSYMAKNFNDKHPKVLIMSSINRENMEVAQKALNLGASDYVEKPNVKELNKCVEELVSKLDSITDGDDNFERFEIKDVDQGQDNFNCIISGYAKDLGRVEELITEIGKSVHFFIVPANSAEKAQIEAKLASFPVPHLKVCDSSYLKHHGFTKHNTRTIALSDSYNALKSVYEQIGMKRFLVEDTGVINFEDVKHEAAELVPFESVVYEIKRGA